MIGELISEEVDIYELPIIPDDVDKHPTESVTLGDLHGNSMKLLFMLIRHGVLSHVNEKDYRKLVELYCMSPDELTRDHLDEFNQTLTQVFSHCHIDKGLIRLIGDELADRGANDYFTLKVLEKLHQHNVPFEILISNHGMEFFEAYETKKGYLPIMLEPQHACSLSNLKKLLARDLVNQQEIDQIVKHCYAPKLRVMSYTLSVDKTEINLYSHAPVGLDTIKWLPELFTVSYKDTTAQELAETIDAVNAVFQKHVKDGTVHELYDLQTMWIGYRGRLPLQEHKLEFLLWNRDLEFLERPKNHQGYCINYVHGHDGTLTDQSHVCNLDNILGKDLGKNQGKYTVLSVGMAPNTLSEAIKNFLSKLESISVEGRALIQQGHVKAGQAAINLHKVISSDYDKFINNQLDYEGFKVNSLKAIGEAKPKLLPELGWEQLLANLILSVLLLGVFYLLAISANKITSGNFLFFQKKSLVQTDPLEKSIIDELKTKPPN